MEKDEGLGANNRHPGSGGVIMWIFRLFQCECSTWQYYAILSG